MSYCVNCGVELAPSEKSCPLCNTEVLNPKQKWHEPEVKPYPNRVEQIMKKVNRKYVVSLIALLLLIPAVIPVMVDLVVSHQMTWSSYVVGAVVCVFFFVVFPLLYEIPKPYLYLVLDSIVLVGYIALIAYTCGGMQWFYKLGLPIVISVCLAVSRFIFVARRSRLSGLKKAAIGLVLFSLMCMSIDFVINRFVGNDFALLWSLFVVSSCIVIAAMLLVLDRRKNLRDEIIKRLFV
jgi:hypothetical protein